MRPLNKNYIELLTYLLLRIAGLASISIGSLLREIEIPKDQQDFLYYVNYTFTKPVGVALFVLGIMIGYFTKLNPLMAGMSQTGLQSKR